MSPVPLATSAGTHLSKSPAWCTGWIASWAQGGEGWALCVLLPSTEGWENSMSKTNLFYMNFLPLRSEQCSVFLL